jgi:hypothetical protein
MPIQKTEMQLREFVKDNMGLSTDYVNTMTLKELKMFAPATTIVEQKVLFDVTYKSETFRFDALSENDLNNKIIDKWNLGCMVADIKIVPATTILD